MEIYTRNWSQNYDHFNSITGEGNIVEEAERDKIIKAASFLAYFQSGGRGGLSLLQLPDGRLVLNNDDSGITSVSTKPISLIELNQAIEEWKNAPLVNDECIGYNVLYYCTGCGKIYTTYNLDFIASGRLYVVANKEMKFENGNLNINASNNIAKCARYWDPSHPKKNSVITLYCDVEKYKVFFMETDLLEYGSKPLTVEDVESILAPESLAVLVQENV